MSEPAQPAGRSLYLSLQVKLLLVFTILFMAAFSLIGVWFESYAVRLAVDNLQRDLRGAALSAAAGVDGEAHRRLFAGGAADDASYTMIADSFRAVMRANPKVAGIYSYVQNPGERELRFVVSSLPAPGAPVSALDAALQQERSCNIPPSERPALGELYPATPDMVAGLSGPHFATTIVEDEWGQWLSGFAPIYDSSGAIVGAVGVDMCAGDVSLLKEDVRAAMLSTFGITLGALVVAILVIALGITHPIKALTHAAGLIGQGDYTPDTSRLAGGYLRDEVTTLAGVFEVMVRKVREREDRLKQQVADLQIMIDEKRREQQIKEIVDTDFFRDLQQKARALRTRKSADGS